MLPWQVALFAAFLSLKVDSRELFVFRSISRPALHSTSPLVATGCLCLSVPLVNQSFFAIALLTTIFPSQRRHPILRFFFPCDDSIQQLISAGESQFSGLRRKPRTARRRAKTQNRLRKTISLARFSTSGTPRVLSPVLRRRCVHSLDLFHPSIILRVFCLQRSNHNLSRTPFGLPCPSFRLLGNSRWRFPHRLHGKGDRCARFCHQVGFIAVNFAHFVNNVHFANNLPVVLRLLPLITLAHHELRLRQVNLMLLQTSLEIYSRGTVTLLRPSIRPTEHQILRRSMTNRHFQHAFTHLNDSPRFRPAISLQHACGKYSARAEFRRRLSHLQNSRPRMLIADHSLLNGRSELSFLTSARADSRI